MFGSFLKSLLEPQAEPLHDDDARLAMTALLVRLARADNEYAAAEIHRITQVIMARYELAEPEAIALRETAETLEQEAPDTVRFTRAIKDRFQLVAAPLRSQAIDIFFCHFSVVISGSKIKFSNRGEGTVDSALIVVESFSVSGEIQ